MDEKIARTIRNIPNAEWQMSKWFSDYDEIVGYIADGNKGLGDEFRNTVEYPFESELTLYIKGDTIRRTYVEGDEVDFIVDIKVEGRSIGIQKIIFKDIIQI